MSTNVRAAQPLSLNVKPQKKLADTPENRALLQKEAGKDGKASVVAKQGNDVVLLSGAYRTESKSARVSADQGISRGDTLQLNGSDAQVLHTDDGFKEVDLSGVTVAVVDTGMQIDHPAFKNSRMLPAYNAKTKTGDVKDGYDHGTHVAGIIAGHMPEQGVEGMAQGVPLLPVKLNVTWSANVNFMPRLADSIRHAVDNGAKVINISQGIDMNRALVNLLHKDKQHLVDEALAYAEEKGVVVIASAGNEGKRSQDNVTYPATAPTVIAVSNLDDRDPTKEPTLARSSSVGPTINLSAPGTDIMSSVPGSKAEEKTGTSMASPYVAAVVAQIVARHPDWTPAQIREHLYKTADDQGEPGHDSHFGHGVIDPFEAIYGE